MTVSKVVFLLEERSMAAVLDVLAPKLLPRSVRVQTVPHEGKSDLETSIPRKLRAWLEPGVRFVVVRDKDSEDCRAVKRRLADLCRDGRRPDTLIRIAVHELEAWYLGDLAAVAAAYSRPRIVDLARKARYRDPDAVANASEEIARIVPEFQKISGAVAIAPHLDPSRNRSRSFKVFVTGLQRLFDAGPGTGPG